MENLELITGFINDEINDEKKPTMAIIIRENDELKYRMNISITQAVELGLININENKIKQFVITQNFNTN